jgi:hypothetical protein
LHVVQLGFTVAISAQAADEAQQHQRGARSPKRDHNTSECVLADSDSAAY